MSLHTHTAKVLLVDDHPLVLESNRQLLDSTFTIVGMVQDSGEIISRALEHRPDVILLDACMPGLSGFAATKQLKKLLDAIEPGKEGEPGALGDLIVQLNRTLRNRERDLQGTLITGAELTGTLSLPKPMA